MNNFVEKKLQINFHVSQRKPLWDLYTMMLNALVKKFQATFISLMDAL